MTITRLSGRQLNQDVSCAKPAAGEGPAIKTALEEPACARLFHDVYRRLDGRGRPFANCWISRAWNKLSWNRRA